MYTFRTTGYVHKVLLFRPRLVPVYATFHRNVSEPWLVPSRVRSWPRLDRSHSLLCTYRTVHFTLREGPFLYEQYRIANRSHSIFHCVWLQYRNAFMHQCISANAFSAIHQPCGQIDPGTVHQLVPCSTVLFRTGSPNAYTNVSILVLIAHTAQSHFGSNSPKCSYKWPKGQSVLLSRGTPKVR